MGFPKIRTPNELSLCSAPSARDIPTMPVEAQPIVVTLTEAEQRLARFIAAARHAAARGAGVRNAKIGPQSDEQTDLDGFGAELAYAKLANLYPDLTTGARSGGDDFRLPDGGTVDVKQTRYENGRLLATLKKAQKPCDFYVLMVGTFPTYRFGGWAAKESLFRPEYVIDLGHGSGFALEQDQLVKEVLK